MKGSGSWPFAASEVGFFAAWPLKNSDTCVDPLVIFGYFQRILEGPDRPFFIYSVFRRWPSLQVSVEGFGPQVDTLSSMEWLVHKPSGHMSVP